MPFSFTFNYFKEVKNVVEVRPFPGIKYTKKAGKLEHLIAQPYDKISPEMQKEYYENSEYNYCRLTLPIEDNRYEISKERLQNWMENDIFKEDEKPGFYIYYQNFEINGKEYIRRGFFGAVKLHHFTEDIVLPHEWTHKGPKIDRLNMLKATQKFLEAGFMLYDDSEKKTLALFEEITSQSEPEMDVIDSLGVRNRVWKIDDPEKIKVIQAVLKKPPGQVVIADGHHRYETACGYRDDLREQRENWTEDAAANFRMTLLVPVQDEGLVILPSHRVLAHHAIDDKSWEEINKYFDVTELEKDNIQNFLDQHEEHAFVLYTKGHILGLKLKSIDFINQFLDEDHAQSYKELDVVIVREILFNGILQTGELKIDEDIFYIRWIKDAIAKIDADEAKTAVLMNATRAEQVLKTAKKHERMPQKSTDFYPKMISGLLMQDISEGKELLR
ncbi:MAG: DUF1015 family protein [Candidatus Heimdallarchaeota archaeon]|nr:DUF1015 family protein [Candidatus Heimdallarchaeota archaeon]